MTPHVSASIAERLCEPDLRRLLMESEVRMAFLFGSRARGQEHAASDVDIAVLLPDSVGCIARLERATALAAELSRRLELRADVVVLNEAGPLLRFEAVIRGKTVLGPDLDEVFQYEQRVRMEFEDFRHIQRFFVAEHRRRLGLDA
jgi:predicted nucleotidyltransferase